MLHSTIKILLTLSLGFCCYCENLRSANTDDLEQQATTNVPDANRMDNLENILKQQSVDIEKQAVTGETPVLVTGTNNITTPPPNTGEYDTGKKGNLGLIIGGSIVGGIALIIAAIVAWNKKKKKTTIEASYKTTIDSLKKLQAALEAEDSGQKPLDEETKAHIKHLENLVTQKDETGKAKYYLLTGTETNQEIAKTLELTMAKVREQLPEDSLSPDTKELLAQAVEHTNKVTEGYLKGIKPEVTAKLEDKISGAIDKIVHPLAKNEETPSAAGTDSGEEVATKSSPKKAAIGEETTENDATPLVEEDLDTKLTKATKHKGKPETSEAGTEASPAKAKSLWQKGRDLVTQGAKTIQEKLPLKKPSTKYTQMSEHPI